MMALIETYNNHEIEFNGVTELYSTDKIGGEHSYEKLIVLIDQLELNK